MQTKVMNIQNFSLHDGSGIRTTIFLAGCPLRCKWCANPEGFNVDNKIGYYENTCIGCGRCQRACPYGIGINLNSPYNRSQCVKGGLCVLACPNNSRKNMVLSMSDEEIIDKIKPYIGYFRASNGGVTFSGGEATFQGDSLYRLAKKLYDMGISLNLETCGFFDYERLYETLILFDTIFVDIKILDLAEHILYTGVSNSTIISNIKKMSNLPGKIVVRVPVIVGVNCKKEVIEEIAGFVKQNLPEAEIELLPYHNYGDIKYTALGLPLPSSNFVTPTSEEMKELVNIIKNHNVNIADYNY